MGQPVQVLSAFLSRMHEAHISYKDKLQHDNLDSYVRFNHLTLLAPRSFRYTHLRLKTHGVENRREFSTQIFVVESKSKIGAGFRPRVSSP